MPNPKKLAVVKEVGEKFAKAKAAYFTDYKGISVERINEIRSEFFKNNVDYQVIKKTLTKLAAKEAGYENIDELMDGQMGVAFTYDNPTTPAKVITKYVKDNKLDKEKKFNITGVIFEGEKFGKDQVPFIVDLPSREDLYATLLGTLQSPMSNLVGVMGATMRNLAGVLEAVKDKKQ